LRLFYQYGVVLNVLVVNLFYNYETVETFPKPLRDRKTVTT
jgi:hypothetical protein